MTNAQTNDADALVAELRDAAQQLRIALPEGLTRFAVVDGVAHATVTGNTAELRDAADILDWLVARRAGRARLKVADAPAEPDEPPMTADEYAEHRARIKANRKALRAAGNAAEQRAQARAELQRHAERERRRPDPETPEPRP
jgi:hypothetical protein